VRDIAYKVRDVMRENPNIKEAQLDWNEQSPYLKLVVDQDRARALGLTPQDVSQALSMLISGRAGDDRSATVSRRSASSRVRCRPSGSISAASATSRSRHATVSPCRCSRSPGSSMRMEEPIMWRRNRDMAITVRSDVADGVQAPDVTNQIWPKLQEIRDSLPPATDRGGRCVRGISQGQRVDLRAVSADGARHADAIDDPAAELFAAAPGLPHSTPRHRRWPRSA